jgi:hypothetical protein
MALTLTFDGPDDILEDGLLAYAKSQGWTETIVTESNEVVSNPVSAAKHAEQAIKDMVLSEIIRYERRQMAVQAQQQAAQAAHNKYSAVK